MKKGTKVRIAEESIYNDGDRHNPIDKIGKVHEYISDSRIIVDWGGFTNSYRLRDLIEVK